MTSMSNVGQGVQNGRLNPRQIATKLIPVKDGAPVRALDASDEQFNTFIKEVGIQVKEGEEGEKWSFDNRCRAINFALKRGLHLPFVEDIGVYAPYGPLSKASQDAFSERVRQQNNSDVEPTQKAQIYPPVGMDMRARAGQNAQNVCKIEKQLGILPLLPHIIAAMDESEKEAGQ